MGKGRLEAFTDGVLAIILTIMVLELKVPAGSDRSALLSTVPILLTYALSYVNVGVFWNNHHHMLHATERINGAALWANLLLLFWMSLIPFVIRWMNDTHFAAMPTASYGVVLLMSGFAYLLLEHVIIRYNGPDSKLARAVGSESKGKLSLLIYLLAIPLAFVHSWIAIALYAFNAVIWFVPDKRIESLADL
jgi:uncharacterized membrane protein